MLQDFMLMLYGTEKKLRRAQQLVQTLLETGEWVRGSERRLDHAAGGFL